VRNFQKKKNRRTNNNLQAITHTTEDGVIQTPLKPEVNSCAPEG